MSGDQTQGRIAIRRAKTVKVIDTVLPDDFVFIVRCDENGKSKWYRAKPSALAGNNVSNCATLHSKDHGIVIPPLGVIPAYVDSNGVIREARGTAGQRPQFVITKKIDKDNVEICCGGIITTNANHGLGVGLTYYADPNVSGGITGAPNDYPILNTVSETAFVVKLGG